MRLKNNNRSGWRLPPDTVGLLVLSAMIVAVVFATLLMGCSSNPPPCVPTSLAAIVLECRAQYRKAGCNDDPETKCPELVKACDARVDALSDTEICQP